MSYRPHLLPKIRSDDLMNAIGGKFGGVKKEPCLPCTLRISGLAPGYRCADRETVVGCHTGNLGKGMSTKVSDSSVVAGCMHCHGILDRSLGPWQWIWANREAQLLHRVIQAREETFALLMQRGIITVKNAQII